MDMDEICCIILSIFGGLGIQRVVATLSSSNICALALGASLLYFFSMEPDF